MVCLIYLSDLSDLLMTSFCAPSNLMMPSFCAPSGVCTPHRCADVPRECARGRRGGCGPRRGRRARPHPPRPRTRPRGGTAHVERPMDTDERHGVYTPHTVRIYQLHLHYHIYHCTTSQGNFAAFSPLDSFKWSHHFTVQRIRLKVRLTLFALLLRQKATTTSSALERILLRLEARLMEHTLIW